MHYLNSILKFIFVNSDKALCIVVHLPCHARLSDSMDCSTPGLPVPHHLLELAQFHVHYISIAIQPSHPVMPSSPSAPSLSQHQGLLQ